MLLRSKCHPSVLSKLVWTREIKYSRLSTATSSVNKQEVEKFAAVGSDWWESSSKRGTGPLHDMNPTRVAFIRNAISSYYPSRTGLPALETLRGLKILDVGCGGGILSESLARLGALVTAIDPSMENIAVAKKHSARDPLTSTIDYRHMTVEDMAASSEKFDVVCSLEVIEHVEFPHLFVRSCCECLKTPLDDVAGDKRGGSLILSTINRTPKAYALAILGAEYVLGIVPRGTHDWNKFITPAELSLLITTPMPPPISTSPSTTAPPITSMKVIKTQGIVMKPCLHSASKMKFSLSDNDVDINYILHAVSQ